MTSEEDERGEASGEGPEEERLRAIRLLSLGLDSEDESTGHGAGTRFGDYELGEEIGRGGQAVVFSARHAGIHRTVALKLMRGGDLATEDEIRRFRFGAEAAANLEHPNIVPVFHVGECGGRHFFTMRYLRGGNLTEALARFRKDPAGIALLMTKVARAVQHAHERGVLHRDLKPANIVLDDHLEPYVVDFGLAKVLDGESVGSHSEERGGTVRYMAPEQAFGRSRDLTVTADVFSLGVILYELLTGRVPSEGETLGEVLSRMRGPDPIVPPHLVDPSADAGLSLVCMKCLESEPGSRYRSSEALALDLQRWLRGEPLSVAPAGRVVRALHWCRRHPAAATAFAGAVLVFSVTAGVGWSVARGQQDALRREMLDVNRYAAQAIASQVLLQLRDQSERLLACARDPRIVALFGKERRWPEARAIDELLRECGAASIYDSLGLFDERGVVFARAPEPPRDYLGKDYHFRDYFVGARRLGELGRAAVYVGRVHRSEADEQQKMSIATPVFGEQGRWMGVVNATIGSDSSLGSLRLRENGRQMASLVGMRDRERAETNPTLPTRYMVLVHDRLDHGQSIPVSSPALEELARMQGRGDGGTQFRSYGVERTLADDRHVDPVPGFEGRWLAGFAPVGDTGYAVIVQTRYEAPLEIPKRAFFRVLAWCAVVFSLGAVLVLALARTIDARQRSRRG